MINPLKQLIEEREKEFEKTFPKRDTAIFIHARIGETAKKIDELKSFNSRTIEMVLEAVGEWAKNNKVGYIQHMQSKRTFDEGNGRDEALDDLLSFLNEAKK